MNTAVLLYKLWKDARWLLLGCFACEIGFSWLRIWFVSKMDTSRFRQILELLPGDIKALAPVDFDWLVTFPGRVSFTLDEPIVILCLILWAVARGSDIVSGELERGTLEMLLAQPLSRTKYFLCHSLITWLGIVVICSGVFCGMWLGTRTTQAKIQKFPSISIPLSKQEVPIPFAKPETTRVPMYEKVDVRLMIPAITVLSSMGLFFAAASAFVSAIDRFRWRTIGVMVTFYILESILRMISVTVASFGWCRYLTVFTMYEPSRCVEIADRQSSMSWSLLIPVAKGEGWMLGAGGAALIFCSLALVLWLLAWNHFRRRDLPAAI